MSIYDTSFYKQGNGFVASSMAPELTPPLVVARVAKRLIEGEVPIALPIQLSLDDLDEIIRATSASDTLIKFDTSQAQGVREIATQILDLNYDGKLPEPLSFEERHRIEAIKIIVPAPEEDLGIGLDL